MVAACSENPAHTGTSEVAELVVTVSRFPFNEQDSSTPAATWADTIYGWGACSSACWGPWRCAATVAVPSYSVARSPGSFASHLDEL